MQKMSLWQKTLHASNFPRLETFLGTAAILTHIFPSLQLSLHLSFSIALSTSFLLSSSFYIFPSLYLFLHLLFSVALSTSFLLSSSLHLPFSLALSTSYLLSISFYIFSSLFPLLLPSFTSISPYSSTFPILHPSYIPYSYFSTSFLLYPPSFYLPFPLFPLIPLSLYCSILPPYHPYFSTSFSSLFSPSFSIPFLHVSTAPSLLQPLPLSSSIKIYLSPPHKWCVGVCVCVRVYGPTMCCVWAYTMGGGVTLRPITLPDREA